MKKFSPKLKRAFLFLWIFLLFLMSSGCQKSINLSEETRCAWPDCQIPRQTFREESADSDEFQVSSTSQFCPRHRCCAPDCEEPKLQTNAFYCRIHASSNGILCSVQGCGHYADGLAENIPLCTLHRASDMTQPESHADPSPLDPKSNVPE